MAPAFIESLRAAVPLELRELPRWVLWRKSPKKDRPGEFDKLPFYATTKAMRHGKQGTAEDRANLVTFEEAVGELTKGARFDGVGFAPLDGDLFFSSFQAS